METVVAAELVSISQVLLAFNATKARQASGERQNRLSVSLPPHVNQKTAPLKTIKGAFVVKRCVLHRSTFARDSATGTAIARVT
mgnify:CR=1 FL=1